MRVDGNQTILVWHALASGRRHIRDMGPELEALVTIAAPHKYAMNQTFKGAGPGIIEIALKYDKEAYRCVQAVQLGEEIYVLHAFQKKSKRGIATPKKDVDLIKKRYQEARELAKHEKK